MDLVAEQLAAHLARVDGTQSSLVRARLRWPNRGGAPSAQARAFGRFAQLPLELALARPRADFFHVADHSYAHLALLFPRRRVGVYCHDLDAFRAGLPGSRAARSRALLSQLLLRGLRHAGVVFYSTQAVREEILAHALVPADRLIPAPFGVADEYLRVESRGADAPPYLLHVGSCIPRKNVEFLLRVFARIRARHSQVRLVQIGGHWTSAQRELLTAHALAGAITQRRGLDRNELAQVYAGAAAVLVPSLAEGFGLPVIEAVACGAPVIASDLPVLREVGTEGVRFASTTDEDAWVRETERALVTGERVTAPARERVRSAFSWDQHARQVAAAYANL